MVGSSASAVVEEVAGNLMKVESVGREVENQKELEMEHPKEKQGLVPALEPLLASVQFFRFSVAEKEKYV